MRRTLFKKRCLRRTNTQDQFRGETEEELQVWLRRIMAHNVADVMRKFRGDKRDISREQRLRASLTGSSRCLDDYLAGGSQPDHRAMRNEQLAHLAAAIDALPDDQRQAVILHHLRRQSAAEIAVAMGRTEVSVAGLLRRGMKQLREQMPSTDEFVA